MYFPAMIYFAWPGVLRTPLPPVWVAAFLFIDAAGQFSRLLIKKKAANYFGKAKTALVTILLATLALDHLHAFRFMTPAFVHLLTVSCVLLAFMSAYCKVIPDMWYANSLTLANFLCGLAAIWNVHQGRFLWAFVLVFIGQFFDLFDGRLARIYGSTRHGPMFDDVADATSFGVAIGYLTYRAFGGGAPEWLLLFTAALYVGCTVFRLYRFLHPTVELAPGTFQGMPAPAGAMLTGSSALLFGSEHPVIGLAAVFITAGLMVSSIRYRHFAQRIWPELPRTMKLLIFILFLIFINIAVTNKDHANAFSLYCFVMGIMYAVLGIDRDAYRKPQQENAEMKTR
jgi:CDP-diacylglycerol--serine O-phosphatidyltransferase